MNIQTGRTKYCFNDLGNDWRLNGISVERVLYRGPGSLQPRGKASSGWLSFYLEVITVEFTQKQSRECTLWKYQLPAFSEDIIW